jgi:hypothetical protein
MEKTSKILVLLSTLLPLMMFSLIAQHLPPTPQLEKSLTEFYMSERDAHLAAFQSRNAGKWKDLLPSVGVGYTVSNAVRPMISWSPASIINRADQNKQVELDRKAIIMTYEVKITDQLYKLHQLITDYDLDLASLKAQEETLQIDELLFDITEEKYAQNLLKPSEHLAELKKIKQLRHQVDEFRRSLAKSRAEIKYVAKFK